METGSIGNGLKKIRVCRVGVGSGDCRMLVHRQGRNRLWENKIRIEIRVVIVDAITSPPTGIERELHQIGETHFSAGSSCSAARKSAKRLQIYGRGSLRCEIGVEKVLVGEF